MGSFLSPFSSISTLIKYDAIGEWSYIEVFGGEALRKESLRTQA